MDVKCRESGIYWCSQTPSSHPTKYFFSQEEKFLPFCFPKKIKNSSHALPLLEVLTDVTVKSDKKVFKFSTEVLLKKVKWSAGWDHLPLLSTLLFILLSDIHWRESNQHCCHYQCSVSCLLSLHSIRNSRLLLIISYLPVDDQTMRSL